MLRFLVNPASAGGRARRHLGALEAAAAGRGAELRVTADGDDLVAEARRAAAEGVERLVVAGGDGSAHLAVQGLAGSATALALLPLGRGNDLALGLGVPAAFDAALELALEGAAAEIDLLRSGERFFSFYGGVGFDAAVSATADRHPRWWPDSLTYNVAVVRTLLGFRPPTASLAWEGGGFEGRVYFATAMNGPRFGAGMLIAPMAEMDDGELDLVIVRAVPRRELLRVFPKVYRGAHVGHPAVSFHRTPWVRMSFEPPAPLASDGEVLGEVGAEPIEIAVARRALKIVTGPRT